MTSRAYDDDHVAGSVHEETARLFAALEGAAAAWAGAADDRAADDRAADDHLPTTCGVCPVCLALDHVGRRHPEVLVHLGEAVQALGAAFTALTAGSGHRSAGGAGEQPRPDPEHDGDRAPSTERIDVTD